MNLKWTKECYLCECPLEPCVHTKTTEERILVREYIKMRPIFTINNDMYLKFFGTEVKRVCYACYINSYKVGITMLRDRECGRIKNIYSRPKSKTKDELVYWFEGLKRYLNKRIYIT
jgi:hypothetical protein